MHIFIFYEKYFLLYEKNIFLLCVKLRLDGILFLHFKDVPLSARFQFLTKKNQSLVLMLLLCRLLLWGIFLFVLYFQHLTRIQLCMVSFVFIFEFLWVSWCPWNILSNYFFRYCFCSFLFSCFETPVSHMLELSSMSLTYLLCFPSLLLFEPVLQL